MGVVQNSIDIQKIIDAGGDPTIAAKVAELEAEIGDENSGIIKDIDDLQEANARIMTSVSAVKTTADRAKARADQAVLWSERKGYVGKNLAPNVMTTNTTNDVTFTVNTDKSVTVSGTASANAQPKLFEFFLKAGTYLFSGIPAGASANGYGIDTAAQKADQSYIFGHLYSDGQISFSEDVTLTVRIMVKKDTAIETPITFYPMIRLASVADSTYEPYLPNNDELLQTATLKSVTAAAADFAAFKTAIAAL